MTGRWPKPFVQKGSGPSLLRTTSPQATRWESILPERRLGLPAGLGEIDEMQGDPRIFELVRPLFDPVIGRPSIPMETYLRMMFLRYRCRLGPRGCAVR